MPEAVLTGNYPNPTSMSEWADHEGRIWHRRGERGQRLDAKRCRRLLRNDGVPLATWSAGDVAWFDEPTDKATAAQELHERTLNPVDVFASEWKSDDGARLLMLEHFC